MTFAARTLEDAVLTIAAPVAHAFSTSVTENTTNNNMPLSITGSFSSVTVSTNATNGNAFVSGGTSILYTPTGGFTGSDSFQYTATGVGGTSPPATGSITVNPLPFTPVTNTYTTPGSFTETVPTGASFVTITAWGPGGGGVFLTAGGRFGAGGGGQAVYAGLAVSGGQTFSLSVPAGGIGVTNASPGGTGSPTQVVGSFPGLLAASGVGATSGGVGAGGTATGGTTNTTGAPGSGGNGGAGANGGAGGVFGTSAAQQPGGGGAGGGNGAAGEVQFSYS